MAFSLSDVPSAQPGAEAAAAPPPSTAALSEVASGEEAEAPPSYAAAPAMPAPAVSAPAMDTPASAADAAAAAAADAALDAADEQKSQQVHEGLLAQDWLNRSAAQLTYLGLEQLHHNLEERTLVVFFRNNHFSTLTKHGGELYLLATDIGYLHETDVVWERLNQVDGDSILCDAQFRSIDLTARADAEAVAAADAAEVAAQAQQFSEGDAQRGVGGHGP